MRSTLCFGRMWVETGAKVVAAFYWILAIVSTSTSIASIGCFSVARAIQDGTLHLELFTGNRTQIDKSIAVFGGLLDFLGKYLNVMGPQPSVIWLIMTFTLCYILLLYMLMQLLLHFELWEGVKTRNYWKCYTWFKAQETILFFTLLPPFLVMGIGDNHNLGSTMIFGIVFYTSVGALIINIYCLLVIHWFMKELAGGLGDGAVISGESRVIKNGGKQLERDCGNDAEEKSGLNKGEMSYTVRSSFNKWIIPVFGQKSVSQAD